VKFGVGEAEAFFVIDLNMIRKMHNQRSKEAILTYVEKPLTKTVFESDE